jgi:hypothetical protein
MSPQTGPDLVGAGYPISNPMMALLGGTNQSAQPNVPAKTNLYFPFGQLVDGSTTASANGGGLTVAAVPVLPGDVITKVNLLVGATSAASANFTNFWAALYTGTGSAPGTTGVSPTLIAQTPSTGSTTAANVPATAALSFTFTAPQTITSLQAPYGYIYVAYSMTLAAGTGPSFLQMTLASVCAYPWYATSPAFIGATTASTAAVGSVAPATLGTATRSATVPIVILT